MLQILTPFRIRTLDPRHRSLKRLKNLNSSFLILLYFSFRKTTLCYVSPSQDLQISLVINVYFLIYLTKASKIFWPHCLVAVTLDPESDADIQPNFCFIYYCDWMLHNLFGLRFVCYGSTGCEVFRWEI